MDDTKNISAGTARKIIAAVILAGAAAAGKACAGRKEKI